MRYALISDTHANLPALAAVLADIDGRPDVAAVRVEYDVERTAAAIPGSGLPDDLAQYFETGGMPRAHAAHAG